MTNLRKLIDHLTYIENGGELIRELDAKTGRIVSKPAPAKPAQGAKKWPTTDAEIRAFQTANPPLVVDGLIGRQTLAKLQQSGYVPPAGFKPVANKAATPGAAPAGDLRSNAASNISNTPGSPSASAADTDSSSAWRPSGIAGQNADGSFNADHPFVLAMNRKMAANKNPNGNNGHDGSGIAPDADPANPDTWPTGVTKAPDFGYLDSQGMWIPTPFEVRTEDGGWKTPRNSPANRIGIPNNQLTPFQIAVEKMQNKVAYTSASAIEQVKSMELPNGAPTIPGYTQVDASKFSTDAREPGLNKTLDWVYAYKKGPDFILIAPQLFYNTKISIGRYYDGWVGAGLKTDNDRVPSQNGTVYVANQHFNFNDKILGVVVHTSMGAGNIGPQILKSISGSLKPA
jgi:hypothetical protein